MVSISNFRNGGLRLGILPGLFALGVLMFALAARADVPMTKLTIHVLNDSNKPIDRASVIVRFVEGRAYLKFGKHIRDTYELRTNQEGEATIPEIPQGKILIQIIAHGYQTFGQTFDITEPERTFEIKLNPPQKQYSEYDK
jgi:hypothetical protein